MLFLIYVKNNATFVARKTTVHKKNAAEKVRYCGISKRAGTSMGDSSTQSVPAERIEHKIYLIRGHKVMLDRDPTDLYGTPTFRFNEAVKRNRKRFPDDFMLQLTSAETAEERVLMPTRRMVPLWPVTAQFKQCWGMPM